MSQTQPRDWQPGDVALVRNEYGIWNRAILQVQPTGQMWVYGVAFNEASMDCPTRPLAVVDLKPNEAAFVISVLENVKHSWTTRVADALRVLATPPIEEPTGLGAVVEAKCGCIDEPRRFIHDPLSTRFEGRPLAPDRKWKAPCGHHSWDVLTAVRVLSEGVPA